MIPVRKVPTWLAPWKRKGIEIGREIESFGDVPANWFKERLVGDTLMAVPCSLLIESRGRQQLQRLFPVATVGGPRRNCTRR
jgi:hypothetical protein